MIDKLSEEKLLAELKETMGMYAESMVASDQLKQAYQQIVTLIKQPETENKILRRLLWIRHGCPFAALYGDDGEMQCGNCRIDFKNQPAKTIEETFRRMGMEKYTQQMKEAKEKGEEEK